MSVYFKELDYRETPIGALSLRRRRQLSTGIDIIEIQLNDEFLMSSLFTASEIALGRLGLTPFTGQSGLDVLVGGLGLGYTARAVLESADVRELVVVERLAEIIEWHERGLLVPLGAELMADERCRFVQGDFFALSRSAVGFDPLDPLRRFHAILVDIDHSPRHVLHPSHASFNTEDGLGQLSGHLHPGGVFALWSNDPPDESFMAILGVVFASARAQIVTFPNPLQDRDAASTIYLAQVLSL